MYDKARKDKSSIPKEQGSVVKLRRIGTSMNVIDEGDSQRTMSEASAKRSTMTKASRLSTKETRVQRETELTEKIYAAMLANQKCTFSLKSLIATAKNNGEKIDNFQERTIYDMLGMVDYFLNKG